MQVEAEEAARAAAKEGLGRRLRDAEARAESLAETVDELRAGLDRQRAAADMRCSPRLSSPRTRNPRPNSAPPGVLAQTACREALLPFSGSPDLSNHQVINAWLMWLRPAHKGSG